METNLINRSAVKNVALKYALNNNKSHLTRVSADFLERVNAAVDEFIKTQVTSQPDDGKTIK